LCTRYMLDIFMFKEKLIKCWLRSIHICFVIQSIQKKFSSFFYVTVFKSTNCFENQFTPLLDLLSFIIFFQLVLELSLESYSRSQFSNKMGSKQITFKENASLNRASLFEGEHFSFLAKENGNLYSINWSWCMECHH